MKRLSLGWPLALLFLITALLGACSKDDDDDPEPTTTTSTPLWQKTVEGANFFINSKDVVMNDNKIETNFYNAYVNNSDLPQGADFEYYTISVLVPADLAKYTTEISNVTAKVISGPNQTGNMFLNSTYVDELEFRDQVYSRYRLELRDKNRIANAATFHNLYCELTVTYKDADSKAVVNSRDVVVEVFQNN